MPCPCHRAGRSRRGCARSLFPPRGRTCRVSFRACGASMRDPRQRPVDRPPGCAQGSARRRAGRAAAWRHAEGVLRAVDGAFPSSIAVDRRYAGTCGHACGGNYHHLAAVLQGELAHVIQPVVDFGIRTLSLEQQGCHSSARSACRRVFEIVSTELSRACYAVHLDEASKACEVVRLEDTPRPLPESAGGQRIRVNIDPVSEEERIAAQPAEMAMMLGQRREQQRHTRRPRVPLEDRAVDGAKELLRVALHFFGFLSALAMLHSGARLRTTRAGVVGPDGDVGLLALAPERIRYGARHRRIELDLIQRIAIALEELDLLPAQAK